MRTEEDVKCLVCGKPFTTIFPTFWDRPIQVVQKKMKGAMYGYIHKGCLDEFEEMWKDEEGSTENR